MTITRIITTAILLLAVTHHAGAQDTAMHVNYRKDHPVQISYLNSNYNLTAHNWFVKKLDKKSGFTNAEAETIMARIAGGVDRPKNLSLLSSRTAVVARYKAYQQYYFSRFGFQYSIVWLPYEENQHMPEGLRPTSKEGCVYLLDGKYITAEGKDILGNTLPVAGTPVPSEAIALQTTKATGSTATSGTTASGVQYSKADMSEFGPGLLGCMAIYPSNGSSYMYVVPVYGASLGDKAAVAQEAYKVTGLADSRYRYEWFDGTDAGTLQQRYKKTMSVQIIGKYTIK